MQIVHAQCSKTSGHIQSNSCAKHVIRYNNVQICDSPAICFGIFRSSSGLTFNREKWLLMLQLCNGTVKIQILKRLEIVHSHLVVSRATGDKRIPEDEDELLQHKCVCVCVCVCVQSRDNL